MWRGRGGARVDGLPASGPGSQANFSMPMGNGLLFFIGFIYNITQLSAHYKLKPSDRCWPVLLSNKEGGSRLSVCHKHAAHGDHTTTMHTCPAGWDVELHREKFSSRATTAQCKKAGWKAYRQTRAT